MIKIAYLILSHIDPKHIHRLVKKITENTSNEAFVHVDAKSDIAPFAECMQKMSQVHLLDKRTNVSWGGVQLH